MPRRRPTIYFHRWIIVDAAEPPSKLPPGTSPQIRGTFGFDQFTKIAPWEYRNWVPVIPSHGQQDPLERKYPPQYYELWLRNPLGYNGYDFTLLGTVATADDPPDAPRFFEELPPDPIEVIARPDPIEVIARRRQVYVHLARAVLTIDWDPQTGPKESLLAPVYDGPYDIMKERWAAIERGRDLLASEGRRGPKVGSGEWTNIEAKLLDVKARVRDLVSQGITPTAKAVAEFMNAESPPIRQLYRWYEAYQKEHDTTRPLGEFLLHL